MFTDPAMTREAYANLWTADAVHEYPFAPAPYASQIAGRDAITEYIAYVTQSATNWSFTNLVFSATADPDTVFVEFEGSALVTTTGKKYQQIYMGRITLREGKIANYRELWNPAWILDAFVPAA
ncbi:nuclear transport factor 2 family protein [Chitinophaga sp.]|uniref:nuclear transport factor 2 family protein n=1 Tax=Chitinophaga sp. TaxID=1869181 RepID=UPI0031D55DEA